MPGWRPVATCKAPQVPSKSGELASLAVSWGSLVAWHGLAGVVHHSSSCEALCLQPEDCWQGKARRTRGDFVHECMMAKGGPALG
jgi:hypothetical protein